MDLKEIRKSANLYKSLAPFKLYANGIRIVHPQNETEEFYIALSFYKEAVFIIIH
jgi:hypothetical protein